MLPPKASAEATDSPEVPLEGDAEDGDESAAVWTKTGSAQGPQPTTATKGLDEPAGACVQMCACRESNVSAAKSQQGHCKCDGGTNSG
mmetsp:Transcript_118225/g.294987  ORF Transcript_118225/g.294987 Transcript_118225/m.294987 type:complete len:88 (-) Transcript_118225:1433-1696(-)